MDGGTKSVIEGMEILDGLKILVILNSKILSLDVQKLLLKLIPWICFKACPGSKVAFCIKIKADDSLVTFNYFR